MSKPEKPFGQNSSELSYASHSRQSHRKSPLGRKRSFVRASRTRAKDSLLREVPGRRETLLEGRERERERLSDLPC